MIEYFETRASTYNDRSNRGLWSHVRGLEFAAVVDALALKSGQRILDLGCGAGYYSLQLREKMPLKLLAVDSSPAMLKEVAEAGIPTWLGNAADIPDVWRFDSILAAGLFEFVPEPAPVFKKCAAVVEAGGKLVMLVPNAGWRGYLYAKAHEMQGCPVFIREIEDYIRTGNLFGLELNRRVECTPISSVLEFRRRP